jgi:glutathione S-transferase
MLVLHHLENSRSQRILWTLEELQIPYRLQVYKRNPKTLLAPAELKKIHPLGKSPVITDGELTIAESAVIIEYLIKTYGNGRLGAKAGIAPELRYNYFLHYAESSLMPPLFVAFVFSRLSLAPTPLFLRPFALMLEAGVKKAFFGPQLKSHFDFLEAELAKDDWFAGSEFSAADIQMSYPIEAAKSRGLLKRYPRLLKFVERIESRPAYKRAVQAGGPLSAF